MRSLLAIFAWAALVLCSTAQIVVVDPPVAPVSVADPYAPENPVSGSLSLVGSRTMSELAAIWTDGFRHIHPDVKATFDFQGSETALESLSDDGSVIGLLSRDLSSAEQDEYANAHPGLKLHAVSAAYGAIAVIVHRNNPVPGLSLAQLKTLFAQSDEAAALTWSKFGAADDWANTPVVRIVPDKNSGARGQFVARVLGVDGELAAAKEYSWHKKIVDEVAADRGAVGFVSYANSLTDAIRTVPLSARNGGPYVPLTAESIASGKYPLIRPLSLVVVTEDDHIKNPLVADFVRYVLSLNGQEDVVKDGFQPLNRPALLEQLDKLGWNRSK
jgi:phosphate transport system substrate-binding protein